jgi:tetratricopeptide (TPR) repeat protein
MEKQPSGLLQTTMSTDIRAISAILLLAGAAFAISCRLPDESICPKSLEDSTSSAAVIEDSVRRAIGAYCYRQADVFFHRGVSEVHHAEGGGVIGFLSTEIRPEEHQHLSGQGIVDIMPWLEFAMEADPDNVDYALVAAFWLATDAGRPDVAHEVLRRARIANPRNCRLPAEEARIYIREGRLADARRLADLALELFPGSTPFGPDEAKAFFRDVLLHRAILAEAAGDIQTAIRDLNGILMIYPEMATLRDRIVHLREGTEPKDSARQVLRNLMAQYDNAREHHCDREEDHDHEHNQAEP